MAKTKKIKQSSGDKPKKKARASNRTKGSCSSTWEFKPKLIHEAVVLHGILDIYTIEQYSTMVNDVRNLITSLVQNHGFTDGSKRYNCIKQYTVDLIELKKPENPGWLSTSEIYKVPSKLGETFIQLIVDYFNITDPLLRGKYYRVIITLLNISRVIDGLSDLDFKSIEEKQKSIEKVLLDKFSTYVEKKLTGFQYNKEDIDLLSYKVNFKKSGPNGVPKLESAKAEASVIRKSNYWKPFKVFCSESNIDYLSTYVDSLGTQYENTESQGDTEKTPRGDVILRKLVGIPDSGFKTRIVAIPDFWTQLALEPFRHHVQTVTRKLYIDTDFRLNQDQGVEAMVQFQKRCLANETIGKHTLNIKNLHFYDFTSWTDRYHRDLQKIVVSALFSPRLAQAWAQLVVHCHWNVPSHNRTIKYGQGQGMGTNGSFDIATLTDHLFINFIKSEEFDDDELIRTPTYGKVGDDLWIYDPQGVFPSYFEKINLPINRAKSKSFGELGSIAEFCSRTFLNGEDVSRVSPKIISRSKDFRYIPLLITYLSNRGIHVNRMSFPFLDNIAKGKSESYFESLQAWIIAAKATDSSSFDKLSLEYLTSNNWCTDDTICILQDPERMRKIKIARAISKSIVSFRDIEVKKEQTFELNLSTEDLFDLEIIPSRNFFLKGGANKIAQRVLRDDQELLQPKQMFVLKRLLTQDRLMSENLYKIYELDPLDQDFILDVESILSEVANGSQYDRGNINYDQKAFHTENFEIVKVLKRFSDDFSTLTLTESESTTLCRITGEEFVDWSDRYLFTIEVVPDHKDLSPFGPTSPKRKTKG